VENRASGFDDHVSYRQDLCDVVELTVKQFKLSYHVLLLRNINNQTVAMRHS
jgi:hypothetical protein